METREAARPGGTAVVSGPGGGARGLPKAGEQLGHYAIIRLLGAGGMGAVYEAQDQESGRRVALKVLSHTLDSPAARERFFREGRLAASINHPNSVYIFGTEEIGGTPVITMELVPGGTLQDRVRSHGPLPIGEAVDAVLQLIEGLEAAQRLGILHRDIKPSNCYVGEDGAVKIGDFGLSISTALRTEPALTATGAFLGTPAFCSPEQLRGDELNARSDMYSVGVTLYYLLTGRTPFDNQNVVRLLATVLEQRPPSPRQFRPEIPRGLAKAVLRCLEKQPGERFRNYADLASALAPYSSTAPTPATMGLRFLAGVVDMALLSGAGTVINLSVFGSAMAMLDQMAKHSPKALGCIAGWFVFAILYFAVLEGLWGAAAGKALCRLRMVGPDRNPPGFLRAALRAMIFLLPPLVPYWSAYAATRQTVMGGSPWMLMLVGSLQYVIMGLLFATARRRNGFAAVQDLATGTRVVARGALVSRAVLSGSEPPPPAVESAVSIGPYHVLQTLAESGGRQWLLAYDLKLLRKVWLRVVPPGTEPVPGPLRNLGRVGRVRWLTGSRSPTENWDAFEALTGRPLLELIATPQPWRQVRYWLHDLAVELGAATRDGTMPQLGLDRVWITGEGRAKLLDFPAPGLAPSSGAATRPSGPVPPPLTGTGDSSLQSFNAFLNAVASAALAGDASRTDRPAGDVAGRLPLHARTFLKRLPQMAAPEAIAAAVRPLLGRAAEVSQWRRTAIVAGCAIFPLLGCAVVPFAEGMFREMTAKAPGVFELNVALQMRSTARRWAPKNASSPTDRQYEIYISHHYSGLITNQAEWAGWPAIGIIQGENRKFAEKSVVDFPAPTEAQVKEAEASVGKNMPHDLPFNGKLPAGAAVMGLATLLMFYVAIPAVVAALAFRGGLVLLIAGVTYVRKDGAPASRLRLFWRALVTWALAVPLFSLATIGVAKHWTWQPWVVVVALAALAVVSTALPRRGIQDHLAGTWPVMR